MTGLSRTTANAKQVKPASYMRHQRYSRYALRVHQSICTKHLDQSETRTQGPRGSFHSQVELGAERFRSKLTSSYLVLGNPSCSFYMIQNRANPSRCNHLRDAGCFRIPLAGAICACHRWRLTWLLGFANGGWRGMCHKSKLSLEYVSKSEVHYGGENFDCWKRKQQTATFEGCPSLKHARAIESIKHAWRIVANSVIPNWATPHDHFITFELEGDRLTCIYVK